MHNQHYPHLEGSITITKKIPSIQQTFTNHMGPSLADARSCGSSSASCLQGGREERSAGKCCLLVLQHINNLAKGG